MSKYTKSSGGMWLRYSPADKQLEVSNSNRSRLLQTTQIEALTGGESRSSEAKRVVTGSNPVRRTIFRCRLVCCVVTGRLLRYPSRTHSSWTLIKILLGFLIINSSNSMNPQLAVLVLVILSMVMLALSAAGVRTRVNFAALGLLLWLLAWTTHNNIFSL